MDDEILKTVHSMFGKSVQIVDCEKTSSVRKEEVLLINGIQVTLEGEDGDAIKNALLTGQVPSVELLNQLLYQAGILRQSVQLETSLSVKSSMVTTEEVLVARDGRILDGRSSEIKEDYAYNSSKKEIWKPVSIKDENMPQTSKFQLAEQSSASGASEQQHEVRNTNSVTISQPTSSHVTYSTMPDVYSQMMAGGNISKESYYNFKENQQSNERVDDDDDDDDDDNDEDGESYLLYPLPNLNCVTKPSTTFTNRLPPTRNTPITILSSTAKNINDDQSIEHSNGASTMSAASISGRKSSLLSFDSGHDGVFHSPSEQTATSNNALAAVQRLTPNNTDNSMSSCYDFISSDEADFLTATTSSSNSKIGKHSKTTMENSFADLKQTENLSNFFRSNDENVKSPESGKETSMSSSSCITTNPPSSSSQPKQAQPYTQQPLLQHGIASEVNACLNPSDNTANVAASLGIASTISTTSVENGLVFRDGNLISGPLDALIAHMVPSSQYYPDRSFIFSFLLSARLFIRPHELLARISDTWENQQKQCPTKVQSIDVVDEKYLPQQQSVCSVGQPQQLYAPQFADEQSCQKAIKSAENCIQLLSEWIDTFPYDFRDERLMQHVRNLARKCVFIDNSLGKTVSSILQQLVQRLTVLEKYEEFLQTLTVNENNVHEDLISHQKSYLASVHHGGHTNSGYAGSTSSSDRDDMHSSLVVDSTNTAQAMASSSMVGVPFKSLSSSYTTATGTCYQHQSISFNHHNSHQSDSSSNSVNILGPGGGMSTGGCTSANTIKNGVEFNGISDLCSNAALLAHQLTHIELERLSHIGPEEFVQAFAKENHLESFSDMKKTRNLESYVQWFNRLSYFTATEIVRFPKKKQRVRIIEFWIETARECFNIGNFNSLMAIIAGLNLSPISRLKKTWSKIQSAKFSVLEHQMDPTSNFNSYRSTLKAAMWRSEGATNERERIIIPFFSLLVKDLYFLNEGCSNRLPNGHINFEKFRQLARQVMEFNTWKKVICPFEKLPKVIMFLQLSPVLNENTLSMASFECEPPENNQEKGRYKTLKSETKQQQQT